MRYDERPMNGHNHPTWDPVGILLDIKEQIGGLEKGQELTLVEVRSIRQETRADVVRLHERIDEHLTAAPKAERRGWISYTGLEPKELVSLVLMVLVGLGMLSPEILRAWLGP